MPQIVNGESVPGSFTEEAGSTNLFYRSVYKSPGKKGLSLTYNDVMPGGNTKNHSHYEEHATFIVQGSGVLDVDGKLYPIKAGDVVHIDSYEPHCFRNTGEEKMVLFGILGPSIQE